MKLPVTNLCKKQEICNYLPERSLVLKHILFLLLFLGWFCIGSNTAYSGTMVKGWINKVRPGTFEVADASSDSEGKKARVFSESEMKVLTSLSKREAELRKKEALHQQRAAELKSLSQEIEQKLDQIRKLTAEFEKRRTLRKDMDERDISRIVKYYETMDPERIADFFNQMDRLTAAQIIMRMNPRKASAAFELLDPAVAVDITEIETGIKKDRLLSQSN